MRKKIVPKSAKKASEIAALEALKRGLRKSAMSSIGDGARRSQATKTTSIDRRRTANAASTSASVQPRAGASIRPQISVAERDEGEHEAAQVQPRCGLVAALGHEEAPGDQRDDHDRQVDEEDPAPVGVLDQPAAGDRADRDPDAGDAGPDPDRLAALVRGERRGQDRQRRGHDERAADAHQAAHRDQQRGRGGQRRAERAERRTPAGRRSARACGRSGRRASRRSAARPRRASM